jgi:GNAT superfamily N-acetyltransferase
MEIREIRLSELKELLMIYRHLHPLDEPLPGQQAVEATWQAIQENPDLFCFGGYVDGMLVSSCLLAIIPNLTRGCRSYGIIENVVTHAGFRRKGYGQAVLKHALSHAWKMNCYKVMLLTGRKDEATYRFYESVGFDRHSKQAFLAKPMKARNDIPTGLEKSNC